jgi:hypothetical protein
MAGNADVNILLALLPFFAIYIGWMIYTARRVFQIRNSVLVPSHRYQALWVGASAIYWTVSMSMYILIPFLYVVFPEQVLFAKFPISVATIAILFFGLSLSLAWTDAIVPIARTSDPRNRDSFRWRYSRIILWAILVLIIVYGSYFIAPSLVGGPGTGLMGPVGTGIRFYADIAPYFTLIGAIIAIVLAVSYIQSPDPSLRKHLRWLIAYVITLIVQNFFVIVERSNLSTVVGGAPPDVAMVATVFGVIMVIDYIEALCLYKSAQSLTPVNRFPTEEKLEPHT